MSAVTPNAADAPKQRVSGKCRPFSPGIDAWLTRAQVAEWLQVTPALVSRLTRAGIINGVFITPSDLRYHVKTVIESMHAQRGSLSMPAARPGSDSLSQGRKQNRKSYD